MADSSGIGSSSVHACPFCRREYGAAEEDAHLRACFPRWCRTPEGHAMSQLVHYLNRDFVHPNQQRRQQQPGQQRQQQPGQQQQQQQQQDDDQV